MKPTTSLLGKLGDGWISSRREIPHCQIASSISPWKSVHPWFKWDWIYTFLCPSLKHRHQKPTPPWLLAHCQILAELFTQVQLFPLKVCSVELCLINDSLCSLCGTAWAYYLTHTLCLMLLSQCAKCTSCFRLLFWLNRELDSDCRAWAELVPVQTTDYYDNGHM